MPPIRLYFPTFSTATTTLTINPIFVPKGMTYTRTPFQQRLVAVGGQEYVVKLSTAVELLAEMEFRDLPELDQGVYHGWMTLLAFLSTTLDWSMRTCHIRDADNVQTANARLWTSQVALREMEGLAQRAGMFSGTLLWRQSIT